LRIRLIMIVAVALLLAACDPGIVDSTMGRPAPSEPPIGPIVSSIEVAGTTFTMHDEGDGCLAVDVGHLGLQTTVERRCFNEWNTVAETSPCGWLDEPPDVGVSDLGGCDVDLPRVFYGRITDPAVGYTCVGRFSESSGSAGVVGARILTPDSDGYILEAAAPGEKGPPHFLSPGGSRIGDPPLDAPSDPIYRFCEARAGVEQHELEYDVDLLVAFDESLRTDDVTVFFHTGLDRVGVSGGAFDGSGPVVVPVRVTPALPDLDVQVETADGPTFARPLVWPIALRRLLASGELCDGLTTVEVSVGAGVVDGSGVVEPVELRFAGSDCLAATGDTSTTTTMAAEATDPWKVETIEHEDYPDTDAASGLSQILGADSLVQATIETLGSQAEGGRWCCENPPFTVTDIEVIEGSRPRPGGHLNGFGYQNLTAYLEPGDRVTLLLAGDLALFVFGDDEGIVHPVPISHAAAINAMREREAAWRGYSGGEELSPLEAIRTVWGRYRDTWWGSIEQRTALALSGVPG